MTNMGDEVKKLYAKELAQTKKPNRRLSKPEIVVYTATVLMLLVAFTLGVYYYNKFAILQQYCYAQHGQIEKEFQRRADLIPQLVEVSKDYARHEQGLFKYVADARALLKSAEKLDKAMGKLKKSEIQNVLSRLVALAEQYPDLKATQSFQDLMDKLEVTEDRIASMRDSYVDRVRDYNTLRVTFPSSVFNFFYRFAKIEYYRAESSSLAIRVTGKGISRGE